MSQSSNKPTVESLLDFYTKLLDSLNIDVDSNAMMSMNLGGTGFPVTLNKMGNKRLVLPTRDVLRAAEWDSLIAFHPLAENVYRGESPVLKKLKALVNFRLSFVVSVLMTELTSIASNKDYHEKLTPTQSKLLDYLPKANAKTSDGYTKVINAVSSAGTNRLINIYLKHGGKYKGEDHPRVAVTSFPIHDETENTDKTIFGVKLASQKDFNGFFKLVDYVLPDSDKSETYSYGSRSMDAPYFDALMNAYLKVARQLNKVTWLFRKHLEDYELIHIDTSWGEQLKDLSFYRGLIPGLEGNDGELTIDDREKAKMEEEAGAEASTPTSNVFQQPGTPQAPVQPPQPQTPQQPPWNEGPAPKWNNAPPAPTQPPQAPQPAQPASTGGGVSWQDIMKQHQQAQYPQQPQNQYPQQQWQTQFPQQPQQPQMPPGFAGTSYNPQQQQQQNFQQAPPGTYASHPRNAPAQPAWNMPQQQPAPMGGGIYGNSVI